jgi:branched-subunit amino acid aminotransferase/4-amino-4-deoxychorismate lyase
MPPADPNAFLLQGDRFEPRSAVPVTDRGFRYGMSIFETIAVHESRPLFAPAHLDRLERAATSFPIPATWRVAASQFLSTPPINDGVIRIYLTAGDGAPTDPVSAPRVIALAESTDPPDSSPVTCRTVSFTPQPLPAVKTGNYWPHLIALETARAAGATEAILTTSAGRMISSSMGNVFFQLSTGLVTPPITDGPRDGVIREWVLAHFPATERSLTRTDLPTIQAAFLTNSRVGIRPISRIDDHPLAASPLTAEIATTYRTQILRA